MKAALSLYLVIAAAGGAEASEFRGPGRFCGYSPSIELLEGERIVPLHGGIHVGGFRWEGSFGALNVSAVGWASRPRGRALPRRTSTGQTRFAQQSERGRYTVAIWNRRQGAAYFSSARPLTRAQLGAIDRVVLFQEGEEPDNCKYRMYFSWD